MFIISILIKQYLFLIIQLFYLNRKKQCKYPILFQNTLKSKESLQGLETKSESHVKSTVCTLVQTIMRQTSFIFIYSQLTMFLFFLIKLNNHLSPKPLPPLKHQPKSLISSYSLFYPTHPIISSQNSAHPDNQNARIEWLKDDQPILPHHKVQDSVLIITNAQVIDEGVYKCFLTNHLTGAVESAEVRLDIQGGYCVQFGANKFGQVFN